MAGIAEEDDQKVILKLVQEMKLFKKNIKERIKLDISMMPEILDYLKKEDFFALIKYLQTEEQTK